MKSLIVTGFLSLFIFALVLPLASTLVDARNAIVLNITEEETKEQWAWDMDEKQISQEMPINLVILFDPGHSKCPSTKAALLAPATPEVILPPPEAVI